VGQSDDTVTEHAPYRPGPAPAPDTSPHAPEETGEADADVFELEAGRASPFSMLPDWVALSGIPAKAQALYWQLAMHLNQRRGDRVVYPSRQSLAHRLGMKQARSVDRYLTDLIRIGAIDKRTTRIAGGMRARNRYVLHQAPPPDHPGPASLADLAPGTGRRSTERQAISDPGETAGRHVVRKHALPERAPAHPGSTRPRTHEGRTDAPGQCAPAHPNQTKNNHTQKNQTKTSPSPQSPIPATDTQTREAEAVARALPRQWRLSEATVQRAVPFLAQALHEGWTPAQLQYELTRDMTGARSPSGVLIQRLRELSAPPPAPTPPAPIPPAPDCPHHPGASRRGGPDGQCAGCWADQAART
jgi:hypothetical protein